MVINSIDFRLMMAPTSNGRGNYPTHQSPPQQQQQSQQHYDYYTPSSGGGHQQQQQQPILNRSISNTVQPGQPTQSRSFRILQMITDTASDPNASPPETEAADQMGGGDSGRLSRSSVGSNNSGGAPYRPSYQQQQSMASGPPPPGERRLNLTQEDRQLMDMFRSQGISLLSFCFF